MSDEARDPVSELEGQMKAAGMLIESLEEEVATLRQELGQARVALRAAQKEVAARERALEEHRQDTAELPAITDQSELEGRHKKEIQKLKALAEKRERELRRAQASRLKAAEEEFSKRLTSLKAQKDADNRALQERYTRELSRLRQEQEERFTQSEERRKAERRNLEERLRGAHLQREAELRIYNERLKELEGEKLRHKRTAEAEFDRRVERYTAEISSLEDRLAKLEDAPEIPRAKEIEPAAATADNESPAGRPDHEETGEAYENRNHLRDLEAKKVLAEERIQALENQLREAREENRRNAEKLHEALKELEKLSEPAKRLRAGISLFNASEHARGAASTLRVFGLPKVNVGLDGNTPVITLVWEDLGWRRYVSDPTEGIEEPRVYLTGTGDDPSEVNIAPNARMDARGNVSLGIQAR